MKTSFLGTIVYSTLTAILLVFSIVYFTTPKTWHYSTTIPCSYIGNDTTFGITLGGDSTMYTHHNGYRTRYDKTRFLSSGY